MDDINYESRVVNNGDDKDDDDAINSYEDKTPNGTLSRNNIVGKTQTLTVIPHAAHASIYVAHKTTGRF